MKGQKLKKCNKKLIWLAIPMSGELYDKLMSQTEPAKSVGIGDVVRKVLSNHIVDLELKGDIE